MNPLIDAINTKLLTHEYVYIKLYEHNFNEIIGILMENGFVYPRISDHAKMKFNKTFDILRINCNTNLILLINRSMYNVEYTEFDSIIFDRWLKIDKLKNKLC
jgi:hypothetical protein